MELRGAKTVAAIAAGSAVGAVTVAMVGRAAVEETGKAPREEKVGAQAERIAGRRTPEPGTWSFDLLLDSGMSPAVMHGAEAAAAVAGW